MMPISSIGEITDNASECSDEEASSLQDDLQTSEETIPLTAKEQDDETSHDAPEALVRQENRAVSAVRVIVLLVLVTSAIATSIFVYVFTRNSEDDSFEAEFEAVASRLVTSMTSDMSLKLWIGRTISSAITMAMETTPGTTHLNLTMPPKRWEQLTQEARFNANVLFVSWSPALFSDEERRQFEAFARTQSFSTGANPPCYLCGDKHRGYTNVDDVAELPGFGVFPCGGMDKVARKGVIPQENCLPISQALGVTCMCGDLPPDADMPSDEVHIPDELFQMTNEQGAVPEAPGRAPYHAIWQSAALDALKLPVMYNEMSDPVRRLAIQQMMASSTPVMTETTMRNNTKLYEEYTGAPGYPGAVIYYPVFSPTDDMIVGSVTMEVTWPNFLSAVYPPTSDHVDLVIENSCGQNYTFQVDLSTETMTTIGEGDFHDPKFSHMVRSSTFEKYEQIVGLAAPVNRNQSQLEYCRYRFHVFATAKFENVYVSSDPYLYAVIAGVIFIFTSVVFIFYDVIVGHRQTKVMGAAKRTSDIVSDLFPREVRDRLFERVQETQQNNKSSNKYGFLSHQSTEMHQDLVPADGAPTSDMFRSEPIADFFPHATVMFLDIAGFTAWSSEREPSQVFRLLETIYQSFDEIAKSLGVFKVETIGDSYVAVCGLPTPREHHAVIMAQFAKMCLRRMLRLTRDLEKYLGPSTAELRARVGLHSGPVTAGVLRGEKARFQLFGDTVNTAARLESAGGIHRIHASKETADILIASGKGGWVQARKDLVHMKGKGDLQTYWVSPQQCNARGSRSGRYSLGKSIGSSRSAMSTGGVSEDDDDGEARDSFDELSPGFWEARASELRKKNRRLVDWNTEVLHSLLTKLVACRESTSSSDRLRENPAQLKRAEQGLREHSKGKIVIDEMTLILTLPEFNKDTVVPRKQHASTVGLSVKEQLHDFVTRISHLYRDVPFHNFEHASHVIMSAGKLMKRIVNPDGVSFEDANAEVARQIHARTYGICSDRLMQFAVVFAGLIHDVDHSGLTNAELSRMGAPVAAAYRDKCVAEQNSVDVAWAVLMDDRFKELRACIYTNEEELKRFRQLIVNAVMATDIADKELKTLRESRWDDAFSESAPMALGVDMDQLDVHRKATIVFEYIIQASDVAHTMQHWHTYQKFNRRLFEERYLAWKKGHAGENDPSGGWYRGELWFFDNYIIPLARKLETCGVFGVSHDEYLNYAKENRKEWEMKGEGIVAEVLEACREKFQHRHSHHEVGELTEVSESFVDDEELDNVVTVTQSNRVPHVS